MKWYGYLGLAMLAPTSVALVATLGVKLAAFVTGLTLWITVAVYLVWSGAEEKEETP